MRKNIYIYIIYIYIYYWQRLCRSQRFASLRVYNSRSIIISTTFQSIGKFHGFPRRPVDAKRRGNLNSTRSSLEVMTVMDFAILALCQPMMSFVISSSSRDSAANISESNSQEHSINASKDRDNKTNNF